METVTQTSGYGYKYAEKDGSSSCMTNEFGPSKFSTCSTSCFNARPPDEHPDCLKKNLFEEAKKILSDAGIKDGIDIIALSISGSNKQSRCYNPNITGDTCTGSDGLWGFCGPSCLFTRNPDDQHLTYTNLLILHDWSCKGIADIE